MSVHEFSLIVGLIAVSTTVWGTGAQFLRVVTRGVEGVSLATWTLFVLMGVFWTAYGFTRHSAIIITGSLVIWPMQVYIVSRLSPWIHRRVVTRATTYILLFTLIPTLAWGWSGGIYGTGVIMVGSRFPQIVQLVREKSANGVSVVMWLLGVASSVAWVAYYANERLVAPLVTTGSAALASFAIAMLALWRHRSADVHAPTAERRLATL